MKRFTRHPLRLAVRAIGVAGSLSLVNSPAHAAFTEVTTDNPFDAITSGTSGVSLVLEDYDNDGDLDAVVFHATHSDSWPFDGGDTSFYENIGTASSPEFMPVQDQAGDYGYATENFDANPFGYDWCCSGYGHPVTAGDLDGDDYADFLGGSNGDTSGSPPYIGLVATDSFGATGGFSPYLYQGDFDPSSPSYGSGIMSNARISGYAGAVLVDLDGDTDVDVVVTDYNELRYFRNNGSDGYGDRLAFEELTGPNNPFYGGSYGNLLLGFGCCDYYGAPMAAGDVDNDGDQDVIMGVRSGPADLRLYINEGTSSTPALVEVTGEDLTAAAGDGFDAGTDIFAAPVMADIDDDGDDDLIVVEQQASGPAVFRLFLNDGADRPRGSDTDQGPFGGIGLGGMLLAALGLFWRRRR